MAAISPSVILMLLLSVASQILGLFLLPMTRGLTQPLPTIAAAVAFLLGIGLMARIAHSGVNLSLIVPVIAATVPLGAIAVSFVVYGETATLAKIGTLVVACVLIGLANIL
jgi:multidrug transporter EmrE-like cation transporter